MKTHVVVKTCEGVEHTVEGLTVHGDAADSVGHGWDARFIDGVGTKCVVPITEAEYTRLRALLTGEGEALRCSECPNEVGPGHAVCSPCLKAAVDTLCEAMAYECEPCKDTGWVSAGSSPCQGCYERTRVNKASPDTRTPGQVAYEERIRHGWTQEPWEALAPSFRVEWEAIGAAVLAHGRGR